LGAASETLRTASITGTPTRIERTIIASASGNCHSSALRRLLSTRLKNIRLAMTHTIGTVSQESEAEQVVGGIAAGEGEQEGNRQHDVPFRRIQRLTFQIEAENRRGINGRPAARVAFVRSP
jgi:hypothetical protein